MTRETKTPVENETAPERATLVLRTGLRIQLGFRAGIVEEVRGGGREPYDARVRWQGEKYPVWLTCSSLERRYRSGALSII